MLVPKLCLGMPRPKLRFANPTAPTTVAIADLLRIETHDCNRSLR
jgi:hypothetical protein